jgi:hypothetical protein
MNQIGGIGRVEWYPRDGIRPKEPYLYGELKPIQNEPYKKKYSINW